MNATTTTTTTNAATIDRAAIMRAAHAATRATVAAVRGIDYRATLAAALHEAWDDARLAAVNTATAPDGSAAAELAAALADGEAFYRRLLAMVYFAKRTDGRGFADGTPTPERFGWTRNADDLRAVAHEAYTRLFDMVERYSDRPLSVVMYRAACNAARYIDREERRNARALRYTAADDGDDERRAYIIDNAAPMARERAADPYHAAALADSVERVCNDDTDRAILAAAAYGLTQTETAARVGMSQRAVSKRLQRMRERWTDGE